MVAYWLEREVTCDAWYDVAIILYLASGEYKEETWRVKTKLCEDILSMPPVRDTVNHCARRGLYIPSNDMVNVLSS